MGRTVYDIKLSLHFQIENEYALKLLKDHLLMVDKLEYNERQEALVRGFLAGNVFDWGAKEVVKLMEQGLGFTEAGDKLQSKLSCHFQYLIYLPVK